MALSIQQQYDVGIGAIESGNIDLLAKILTNPDTVTIDEQRSVAEKLGLKKGFLSAAVNTAADPLVWIAALMSRKFPTQAWLKGTVPQRFVGTAAEFSGLSLIGRPVEQFFRGTTIPKLVSLSVHRHAEVMKAAEPIWRLMDRPRWKQEMPIVSGLLEGINPAGATPELREVARQMRGHMDGMWGFLRKAKRIEGGLDQMTVPTARDFTAQEAPRYLRDYLPHIPLTGTESTFELSGLEALSRLGGSRNRAMQQALKLKKQDVRDVWRTTDQDTLTSEFGRYQNWVANVGSEVYNPHLFKRVRTHMNLQGPESQDLFVTDLNILLQKYVSSAARTYAIQAPLTPAERAITSIVNERGQRIMPTDEPIIVQMIREGINTAGVRVRQAPIRGTDRIRQIIEPGTGSVPMMTALKTLTRSVRGAASEDQILFGSLFNRIYGKIDGLRGRITTRQQTQLTDAVSTMQNQRDTRRRIDGLTSYFYTSTLGLNFRSSFQNMLQPIITTAPSIGVGSTIAGIREFAPRVRQYMSDIRSEMNLIAGPLKGLPRLQEAARRSFRKNFSELAGENLGVDPRLFDIDEASLRSLTGPSGKFVDKDSLFKFLLAPFSASEIANRAVTFYGSKHAIRHAIRTGEYPVPRKPGGEALTATELDQLLNFEAANIVNATQFRPGPGSRTVVQSMVPSFIRQFSTFPVRLGNFFAESTVRGAMTQEQLASMSLFDRILTLGTGRNVGTLARTFLYGKIANNGLRDVLGVDIAGSIGLLLPFQAAPQDQPFAPFPIPPGPSSLFGVLSATATRDIEKLQPLELPGNIKIPVPRTWFPAGVQLNRLFRVMNQFRPDMGGFVDEDERLIYHGSNKDMILQALGIPLDKLRRERQIMERLHALRNTDREFGRELRRRASHFDFDGMERVQNSYREAFPDTPGIRISPQQLSLYESSRRKTRVRRMLDTLPGRFDFLERQIYDFDPGLIEPPPGLPLGLGLTGT